MVWMVYLVQWALLDLVYLELQDLKESGDRWASSASQVKTLFVGLVT